MNNEVRLKEKLKIITGTDSIEEIEEIIKDIDKTWEKKGGFDEHGVVKPNFHTWLENRATVKRLIKMLKSLQNK